MSHNVKLNTPIKYAYGGEKQESTFVELIAPNFKQIEHFLPIKQAFLGAVSEVNTGKDREEDNDTIDDDNTITGEQVLTLMMQSSQDMKKVYLHCVELFKSGTALIGGEAKCTINLIETMPLSDFDKLVGEYIANFIATSLLDGIKNNTD